MVLDHTKAHQKYFEEITQIPRGSFHELNIANYIETFAKEHHLRVKRDALHNVIIWKAASLGYEDHAPLILQAHTDMVCEKQGDSDFDFSKDALQLYIEDGFLKAKGTTLGADDGVGVAYMLAILADTTAQHPPLQCIFTVQEEVGLFGALHLSKEDIQATRMINLDDGDETSTCIASAGGMNVILRRTCSFTTQQQGYGYRIEVKGLEGGHSGGAIDLEKGNAHKLLARTIQRMAKTSAISIADWQGGKMDNAIPREANATIVMDAPKAQITEIIKDMQHVFYQELKNSDPGITLVVSPCEVKRVMCKADSEALLRLLLLLPSGLRHRSMEIENLTTCSSNLAIVAIQDDAVCVHVSLRGAMESFVDLLQAEIDTLGDVFEFTYTHEARYPAWSYDAHSTLRETMQNVCKTCYDQELTLVAVHGGLECGVFKQLRKDLEIVTMCAKMYDIHTPQERLDLRSFDRTFTFLTTLLKAL